MSCNWRLSRSLMPTSISKLRELFAEAGVKAGDTIVTYCHIGLQATTTLFAARLAGFEVKMYDGSAQDWGARGRGREMVTGNR